MVASFGIAQYTGVLAAAAPRLTSAVTTAEFEQVTAEIEATQNLFEQQLESLAIRWRGWRSRLVRLFGGSLIN